MSSRMYRAIGLMSGTSMDGVDAALIETDGEYLIRPLGFHSVPYDDEFRADLRRVVERAAVLDHRAPDDGIARVARRLTMIHAEAVGALGSGADVIGFHGHTVAHRPAKGWTWQIGEGALLAQLTRIETVDDFRSADVAAGGQGAPLLPAYHRALTGRLDGAVAILNLGGVGNITFLGSDGQLLAFDTGPGNALIDDWVEQQGAGRFDRDGAFAAAGTVHEDVLHTMLDLDWFDRPPPKSLDRQDFSIGAVRGLSLEDGAATLTAFTAETVRLSLSHLPSLPQRILVTGGGRHNAELMRRIGGATGTETSPVEAVGWRGDAMEAEGFAWFAVRHLRGLPTSFPEISGPREPVVGGRLHAVS
ncbi:anhydro-N-acetylmuramic acid kinase [Pacificimonas flava]|uniref:Anhydro-N-acetylmuramic acid kinase n=2 Tax=Pacificimonas TaxID=1960290 RepID=A0A219B8F3_9SPHN|nr:MULTISPECIES: anhydro-N-acetylmuramic acid kinase [Pacificimonas]MBZ6378703.1 anhydro-N-acetylmuramic acid kinase [Pacificimonas aurantium]OWV34028.1 anhydro-N-acetylmuramic acid kinase [Pacificimonas flava]